MKKNVAWILMVITILSLVGCGEGKNEITKTDVDLQEEETIITVLSATITEISGDTMLVKPVEGSWELSSTDCISVSMKSMPASAEPKVGDTVEITYNGEIMESYPSELGGVTSIKIISAIEEKEQSTGEELPAYEYHGDDMQEAAIIDYFLKENADDRSYGEVSIPAFCIFQSEVDTDDRIKVYGNFWMFTYSRQGTTLFCESGGETPGVIYLKKDGDHYIVDEFDRVGDGSDYAEDIERICDGNKALKEQYFSATDAGKEPLKTRRLWYISNYVKDNGLDITAYQDYGWEPVMLSDTENWDMKKELTW